MGEIGFMTSEQKADEKKPRFLSTVPSKSFLGPCVVFPWEENMPPPWREKRAFFLLFVLFWMEAAGEEEGLPRSLYLPFFLDFRWLYPWRALVTTAAGLQNRSFSLMRQRLRHRRRKRRGGGQRGSDLQKGEHSGRRQKTSFHMAKKKMNMRDEWFTFFSEFRNLYWRVMTYSNWYATSCLGMTGFW